MPPSPARAAPPPVVTARSGKRTIGERFDDGELATEQPIGLGLTELVGHRGPLPVDEAIDVVLQACRLLASEHARGVAHLGLTPATLRVLPQPNGALAVHLHGSAYGRAPAVGYAAPEQLVARSSAGPPADVFTLGALLYELVTGRRAFPSAPSGFLACMHEGIPPMSAYAHVPHALELVVFRCLSLAETERFADALALAHALERVLLEVFGVPAAHPTGSYGPSAPPRPFALPAHWPLVALPPLAVMVLMLVVHVVTRAPHASAVPSSHAPSANAAPR